MNLNLFNLTRNDVICHTNILYILDKLKSDTTFQQISTLFEKIIDKEILYTISGFLIRTAKNTSRITKYRSSTTFIQQ